jgi:hypothetical protein
MHHRIYNRLHVNYCLTLLSMFIDTIFKELPLNCKFFFLNTSNIKSTCRTHFTWSQFFTQSARRLIIIQAFSLMCVFIKIFKSLNHFHTECTTLYKTAASSVMCTFLKYRRSPLIRTLVNRVGLAFGVNLLRALQNQLGVNLSVIVLNIVQCYGF